MSDKDRISKLGDHIQSAIAIASQLNHGFLKQLLSMALLELIETQPDFGDVPSDATADRKGFNSENFSVVGSWDWDLVSDRVYADADVADLFGISAQDAAAGVSIQALLPRILPEDAGHVRTLIERARRSGGAYRATYRVMLPDGTLKHVLAVGRVVLDAAKAAVRFPGTILELNSGGLGSFAYHGPEEGPERRRFEGVATLPRRRID